MRRSAAGAAFGLAVGLALAAGASQVPQATILPFTFSAGAPASASQINANFLALANGIEAVRLAVNDVDARTPPRARFQKKHLIADATASGPVPDLTFTGLTIGMAYRVTGIISLQGPTSPNSSGLTLEGGSTEIAVITQWGGKIAICGVFVADDTTLSARAVAISATSEALVGIRGARSETWIVLEELPGHDQASPW